MAFVIKYTMTEQTKISCQCKICMVIILIIWGFVALIPVFMSANLIQVSCGYNSEFDEIHIDGKIYYNAYYGFRYQFHHMPQNESSILFHEWNSGEVFYENDLEENVQRPSLTRYSIDKILVQNWLEEKNDFHQNDIQCFVDPNDINRFKVCIANSTSSRSYDKCYFQSLIVYNELTYKIVMGILTGIWIMIIAIVVFF